MKGDSQRVERKRQSVRNPIKGDVNQFGVKPEGSMIKGEVTSHAMSTIAERKRGNVFEGQHAQDRQQPKRNEIWQSNISWSRWASAWQGGVLVAVAAGLLLSGPLAARLTNHGRTSPTEAALAAKGKRSTAPAGGPFPPGCRWRAVSYEGEQRKEWANREYEFWQNNTATWVGQMPQACLTVGKPATLETSWWGGSPRTEVNCSASHCIYDKLWYNNGRWYLLVDGPKPVDSWKMTRNQELNVLHVKSAKDFVANTDVRVVKGDTLVFDFVYFLHPTAIGHWCEMLFPLYSILRKEASFARPVAQVVMLHLKRSHLLEWVRSVVAVTLGGRLDQDLPPFIMQREQPDIITQTISPLEGFAAHEWVVFERALVVRDIFTGGGRVFHSTSDAQDFRRDLYRQYDLPPPVAAPVPRKILYQRKRANRRILNEEKFLEVLRRFGEVKVAEFNETTSFRDQLVAVTSAGVYISAHTSNLANSPFVRPGAAVVEIIQRNWMYHGLDQSFQVQTQTMGDIHHFAWRAQLRNQTVYIVPRDGERFGSWNKAQCLTEDCIEGHTNVDIVINLDELGALLAGRLPLVFSGASVKDASIPWPPPSP